MIVDISSIRIDDIGNYVLPILCTVVTHPLTHCRTLMQLGYEPLPKYLGHSILSSFGIGEKVYKYPSIFSYCKHIRNEIGLVGLFTSGLTSRLIYLNISGFISDVIQYKLNKNHYLTESQSMNTSSNFYDFMCQIGNLTIARSVAVTIAYPFQVIMIRQMANIMNTSVKESKYMLSVCLSMIDEEGILSIYSGLKAKLFGEISTIWLTACFVYLFNKFILADRVGTDLKSYTPTLGGVMCSNLMYRFMVVSAVMSVSGSNITGTISFGSTYDCYTALQQKKGFSRGSSLFFRYA